MKTLIVGLLVVIPLTAFAAECRRNSPIFAFSGEEIGFQVTGGQRQPRSKIGVHSESTLVRSLVTDQNGSFTVGGLKEGKYWLSINGRRSASFDVMPLMGLYTHQLGSRVYRLETPEPKVVTVNGHRVSILACPSVIAISD
jgi:hypothetical protein